jgi:hypothetical protein
MLSLTAALALGFATTAARADNPPTQTPNANQKTPCFPSNSWTSWSSTPDGDTLFLRINVNDIYRVDLTPGSHAVRYPGYFLVNRVRGSNWICSNLDLDLSLADNLGYRKPLIATSLRKLSKQEADALPKKLRP